MERGNVTFRAAQRTDLDEIIALIGDDQLGKTRERLEKPLPPAYESAFEAIERDPNQMLLVGVNGDEIVACLQLSFLPGLSHVGAWRAQIEAVRVAASYRNRGIGERIVRTAMDMAKTGLGRSTPSAR